MNQSAIKQTRYFRGLNCAVALAIVCPGSLANAGQGTTESGMGQSNKTYYAESWKKSSGLLENRTVRLRLDRYHASYETIITDVAGDRRYRLAVEPLYLSWDDRGHVIIDEKPPNSTNRQVNLWQIRLYEPDDKVSLLVSNRDQGDVIDINNTLATLAPIEDSNGLKIGIFGVPISSKRVIRVNDSYCVIKVDSYQLSADRDRAFEWILFEIEFTNTKPSLDLADHK